MPAHEPSEKDKLSILMSFVREHEERKTNDKLGIDLPSAVLKARETKKSADGSSCNVERLAMKRSVFFFGFIAWKIKLFLTFRILSTVWLLINVMWRESGKKKKARDPGYVSISCGSLATSAKVDRETADQQE